MYSSFCWGRGGEIYIYIVKHRKSIANHRHRKQTSQVNDFSAFLYIGRWQSVGSLKSSLRYASYVQGQCVFFSKLTSPQGALLGWLQWL